MVSTHRIQSAGKAGLMVLASVALAAAVAAGWYWSADPAPIDASTSAEPIAVAPLAASEAQALNINAAVPTREASASAVIADLTQARQALAQGPAHQPVAGLITERPAYVSPMEWSMLKGLADQHASPPQELTRLVNSLRFNKQFEAWEALPATADTAPQRQALATSLVGELAERVRQQDLGLKDAQKALAALLVDLEPDAAQRALRSAQEEQRLKAAVPTAIASTRAP